MSIDEVAEYFGVSSRTVRRLMTDRKLSAVRVGRQWRIPDFESGGFGEARVDQALVGLILCGTH